MAQELNVKRDFLTGLSSFESAWLDNHNFALHNLWGLTKAGGRNIKFSSFTAGNEYFVKKVGPYIRGVSTIDEFVEGLQREGYNSINPNYWDVLKNRIDTIPKWQAACKVQ